ncbi:hypothetical protein QR680_016629 [Steinernema hermaphroditum]|uniref:MAM domain-containing protein n=1 Tax=Steinernema hermaphroditum TaxID=289476 RepID=A0AA39LM97_9BILA|nr:hypothetical protein QR680_016629 [Steinernema hermaphroditum]
MFCVYALRVFGIILGFLFGAPQRTDACSPLNLEQLAKSGISTMSGGSARILGNPTHAIGSPIPLSLTKPITDPQDLFCQDFFGCRWKNLEGFMMDDFDWIPGEGPLQPEQVKVLVGTSVVPEGSFIMAGVNQVQLPASKAVLVSDAIACQVGQGELRFMYWASPMVKIIVCAKKASKMYPDYDYCSKPIDHGSPGPAYVTIPDLGREPFQIYIRAENFVYTAPNVAGGLAIIDNIEYYGDLCFDKDNTMPTPPPFLLQDNLATDRGNLTFLSTPGPKQNSPCIVLTCSFEAGDCLDYIQASDWRVANRPMGNPLTGIRGDASKLPYNKTGSYAYVEGPKAVSRLTTRSFRLDEKAFLFFAFYKVASQPSFRVYSKMATKPHEELVFDAPKVTAESKRWFKEARMLEAGLYDYLVFEVRDLPANAYVGVDEFVLLNDKRLPYC